MRLATRKRASCAPTFPTPQRDKIAVIPNAKSRVDESAAPNPRPGGSYS